MGLAGRQINSTSRDILNNYDASAAKQISIGASEAFGSWVELVADVGDRPVVIICVGIRTHTGFKDDESLEVEIGIGAASSESREFLVTLGGLVTDTAEISFPVNHRIPANSRISARGRGTDTSTSSDYHVSLQYIKE